ncbi:MAG: hypothetical protein AB7V50_02640 [Vampirovibrionia bacterium]
MNITLYPKLNNIHFKGFQEDVKNAEEVNKEIHRMNLRSNTHIDRRRFERKLARKEGINVTENRFFYKYLDEVSDRLWEILNPIRKTLKRMARNDEPYEDYMKTMIEMTNRHKVGNCGEMAAIAQYLLAKRGISSDMVDIDIYNKKTNKPRKKGLNDHTFLVLNLREKASIDLPQTWGRESIIVDPWFGIVRRSNLALRQINKLLHVNLDKEFIVFEKSNYGNIVDSYKNNWYT